MRNNLFIIYFLFVIVFLIPSCRLFVNEPNVIVIVCDQLSPRAMGWTGETEVATPNLDQFSETAYCFTNAYSASPINDPAMHSLFTGVYPSQHWVLKNNMRRKENLPSIITVLKDHNYQTARVGEIYGSSNCKSEDYRSDLNEEFDINRGSLSDYNGFLKLELRKRNLDYQKYTNLFDAVNLMSKRNEMASVNSMPEELTPEHWITNEALEFMDYQKEKGSGKSFFLNINYPAPSKFYSPLKKYADMYLDKMEELKLPPNFSVDELQKWCTSYADRPDSLTIEDVQYLRAMSFGFISQLDAALGELFRGIKNRGLMENTIIVFTSNHGDNLGEHGCFYSENMWDASVRVPLMFWHPGTKLQSTKNISANVSHIDLFVTLLKEVGITPSEYLQGKDLLPLMNGGEDWADRSVYSEFYKYQVNPSQLMLRKGDFKLTYSIENEDGMFEIKLYNLKDDPYEQIDLAESSDHGVILMEMSHELMDDYWKKIFSSIPRDLLN